MFTQEINIYQVFKANLKTREMAKELFDIALANSSETIVFDFEGVEFISRSFAHEFVTLKQEQNTLGKVVTLENKCHEVATMFDKVLLSQQTPRVKPSKFKSSSFETFDALSTFLSTI